MEDVRITLEGQDEQLVKAYYERQQEIIKLEAVANTKEEKIKALELKVSFTRDLYFHFRKGSYSEGTQLVYDLLDLKGVPYNKERLR